jgi:hypothetical protein
MPRQKTPSKYAKSKALCLLTACLDAVGVPWQHHAAKQGQEEHISVTTKTGGALKVVIVLADAAEPTPTSMEVLAAEITSPHRRTMIAAFHRVTNHAGYGNLTPIWRGTPTPIPAGRKTNRPYGDNPDLVVFRHRLLRQVPNAPERVFKQFDSVVMTSCRFFYRKNERLCAILGYDLFDLKTYAQLWLNIFWSTARVISPKGDENQRLLYDYLRQRFAEFYKQMKENRIRSVASDRQTVKTTFGYEFVRDSDSWDGDSPGAAKAVSVDQIVVDEDDERELERYRDRHDVIREQNVKKRKDRAASLLAENLARLPHEVMVTVLADAVTSPFLCPDTRREALVQLEQHRSNCTEFSCTASPAPAMLSPLAAQGLASLEEEKTVEVPLNVGDQVGGSDTPSPAEDL